MRLLLWLFVILVVAVLLALFAVSNRESVSLVLWPLPFLMQLPLYLAVSAAVLIGFIAGMLVAWIAGHGRRREARQRRRRLAALERELAATQAQLAGPALPVRPPSGALALHG
ncbi:MAG TPA: lipopolysaccharide assembly protein LapA domain-containing protein [Stellaceae bacterium]|jgi:uncharacterized integral membrane protein|nr:lipopolysaccharide assembly protein LapA domain-containing protein [Stellaceae bacterium]